MKKKLLSLVLAGAMVASTSVSAFAEKATGTIFEATGGTSYDITNSERDAEISIEGKIADTNNNVKPSTISVTVPTVAKFTVDNQGNLIGSTIAITSQGEGEVQVIAHKFKDITGNKDIDVVDEVALKSATERNKVSLTLRGNAGAVSLKSETTDESGLCKVGTSEAIENPNDKVIGEIRNGQTEKLTLEGKAVKSGNALDSSVSDTFTLTLKIKKKA